MTGLCHPGRVNPVLFCEFALVGLALFHLLVVHPWLARTRTHLHSAETHPANSADEKILLSREHHVDNWWPAAQAQAPAEERSRAFDQAYPVANGTAAPPELVPMVYARTRGRHESSQDIRLPDRTVDVTRLENTAPRIPAARDPRTPRFEGDTPRHYR